MVVRKPVLKRPQKEDSLSPREGNFRRRGRTFGGVDLSSVKRYVPIAGGFLGRAVVVEVSDSTVSKQDARADGVEQKKDRRAPANAANGSGRLVSDGRRGGTDAGCSPFMDGCGAHTSLAHLSICLVAQGGAGALTLRAAEKWEDEHITLLWRV